MRYDGYFLINTVGKSMNAPIFPGIGEIVTLLFFGNDGFGIK